MTPAERERALMKNIPELPAWTETPPRRTLAEVMNEHAAEAQRQWDAIPNATVADLVAYLGTFPQDAPLESYRPATDREDGTYVPVKSLEDFATLEEGKVRFW